VIVIVFGLPGSGKSYFAERLAARLGASYLSSDVIRREMFPDRTYSPDETGAVYRRLLEQAKAEKKLVIDASFHDPKVRLQFLAADPSARFIEITAKESLIQKRLSKPRAVSEAGIKIYEAMKKQWQPFTGEHLVLESTNENIGAMLEKALAYLNP
jgi:predicted kinase